MPNLAQNPKTEKIAKFLTIVFTFSLLPLPFIYAATNPLNPGAVTNSTTIPSAAVSAPILRAPVADSITNNRYEQFSWTRSTSDTGVSHYTLYLDDIIVSSYITHAAEQNTNQFTATTDSNNLYLTLKSPLSEGRHLWYVLAYGVEGISARSETKYFTIDTTTPIIILQAVDKNTLYWATNNPFTIPPYKDRHLTVTTKNPLLSGKIEAGANFKLSLCQDPSSDSGRSATEDSSDVGPVCNSITINNPNGNWKHRFKNLLPNIAYTAYLSATDAAGNSNIFAQFTIQYTPTPFLQRILRGVPPRTVPTARVTSPSGGGSSEVESELHLPPPPPLPTQVLPKPKQKLGVSAIPQLLLSLALFGLLLHLSLIAFGAGIRLRLLPRLLFILFNPLSQGSEPVPQSRQRRDEEQLFGNLDGKTLPPLATVLLYHSQTQKLLRSTLSNLHGHFTLRGQTLLAVKSVRNLQRSAALVKEGYATYFTNPSPRSNQQENNPNIFFLKATHPGYQPHSQLLNGSQPIYPITLNPKPSLAALERLQNISLTIKPIPLVISLLSSVVSLVLTPNLSALVLLIAGSDLLYTQYLAPNKK